MRYFQRHFFNCSSEKTGRSMPAWIRVCLLLHKTNAVIQQCSNTKYNKDEIGSHITIYTNN